MCIRLFSRMSASIQVSRAQIKAMICWPAAAKPPMSSCRSPTQPLGAEETAGVIMVAVEPDSKAQADGIQKGDLIIEANRKNVASVKNFKNLIDIKRAAGSGCPSKACMAG
jgi:S1-C subfamily serine protease